MLMSVAAAHQTNLYQIFNECVVYNKYTVYASKQVFIDAGGYDDTFIFGKLVVLFLNC